ncbi:hypothetical protein CEXT_231531 [Caerostris extrusa]|uniref:Uncharacterized protein n=1 Tax=Caerostris extrusa TaxID=172846 RepID=A0AAV4T5U2_CAEEX|nr:hypothetical protein CEXT_231531 [Caerostris extrusa]
MEVVLNFQDKVVAEYMFFFLPLNPSFHEGKRFTLDVSGQNKSWSSQTICLPCWLPAWLSRSVSDDHVRHATLKIKRNGRALSLDALARHSAVDAVEKLTHTCIYEVKKEILFFRETGKVFLVMICKSFLCLCTRHGSVNI